MRDLEHCVYHVEDHSITLGHHMRNFFEVDLLFMDIRIIMRNLKEHIFWDLSVLCSWQIYTRRDMVQNT